MRAVSNRLRDGFRQAQERGKRTMSMACCRTFLPSSSSVLP